MRAPLTGVRVVEFEGIGPGPLAGRMLADMGADVTVIARPQRGAVTERLGGAGENPLRRGKRVVLLDLKQQDARDEAMQQIADINARLAGKEITTASDAALADQRDNYIESVQTKVFDRMISERKRIADRHRSEGQGKSAEIRGKKERELKVIESEAYRKTQEIMGRGDAEATGIYAAAYNRDRELYRFVRTMDTYRATVDKNSWLVLSTSADIYKYMQTVGGGGGGGGHAAPHPPKR